MNHRVIPPNMSKKVKMIHNDQVSRLIVSKPRDGEVSVFVEMEDEVLVLSHITVSNISRAFHWVNGHPRLYALEMSLKKLAKHERKAEHPEYALVETERAEDEIRRETDSWLAQSRRVM